MSGPNTAPGPEKSLHNNKDASAEKKFVNSCSWSTSWLQTTSVLDAAGAVFGLKVCPQRFYTPLLQTRRREAAEARFQAGAFAFVPKYGKFPPAWGRSHPQPY